MSKSRIGERYRTDRLSVDQRCQAHRHYQHEGGEGRKLNATSALRSPFESNPILRERPCQVPNPTLQFLRMKSSKSAYRTVSTKTSELKVKSKLLSSFSWYRSRPFCPTANLFSVHLMRLHRKEGYESAHLGFSRIAE